MTLPFYGGCACGAIRYECTAEPLAMLNCHCRDCQRGTGGPFSSGVVMAAEAFKLLQGSMRYYSVPGAMGPNNDRAFCSDCGSPVLARSDAMPRFIGLKVASLDDPSWFKPQMDIFTSEAQSWDYMDPSLPKFEEYPPFAQRS